jgi:AAA domain-containing protein
MKSSLDINDTLRRDGVDAVRARHDGAPKYEPEAPAETGRLRLVMYGDIEPAPRKDWVIADFLGAGELSCIAAAPGAGKSALATDIAGHVAASRRWFGRHVQGGGVLYVAAERAALVERRFAAFRLYHGLSHLPLGIVSGSVDLRTSTACATEIVNMADELPDAVRLIVIDTVSRALAGGDENAPRDMGQFLRNVELLQSTLAHVLLLHHIPADGAQRPRGHGSLLGACDTTFRIDQSGAVRTLSIDKSNDAAEGGRIPFTLKSVELHREENVVTVAPVILPFDGPTPSPERKRKLSDKQALALETLASLCLEQGQNPPASYGLPSDLRAVHVHAWRKELESRGVVDRTGSNPRQEFRRLNDALKKHGAIAERDDLIWIAEQSSVVTGAVAA